MITVNGWCAGKGGGVSVQSMGEMGEDFLQPFLENITYKNLLFKSQEIFWGAQGT